MRELVADYTTVYAIESAMDEMAEKLGIDPVEFRRINDTSVSSIGNKPYTSRSLMTCYDKAAEVSTLCALGFLKPRAPFISPWKVRT